MVGVPAAAVCAFRFNWDIWGLWGGIAVGTVTQVLLQGLLVCRLDWQLMACDAKERSDDSNIDQGPSRQDNFPEDLPAIEEEFESVELITVKSDATTS